MPCSRRACAPSYTRPGIDIQPAMTLSTFVLPLVGGLLIGTAAVLLLVGLGRIAGVSGIAFDLLDGQTWRTGPGWRVAFLVGLIGAGALWRMVGDTAMAPARAMPVPLLVLGGLLVGWGASLGSGCTSGHGVCGLGRRSWRSLAAVLTFMGTGGLTVFVMRHLLGAGV